MILLLLGTEFALRLAGIQKRADPFRFQAAFEPLAGEGMFVEHPTRFFALTTNYRFAPEYAGPYANGNWPFRGRPPISGISSVKTVLVLGDSCVFGIGLEPADTLPHRLQLGLAEMDWDPTTVEVVNLGVPAYSTVQMRTLLEESIEELQPDVVVAYPAAWNDQAPAIGVNDLQIRKRTSADAFIRGIRSSLLMEFLSDLLPSENRLALPEDVESWEERRAIFGERVPEGALEGELEGIVSLCAQRGIALVFIAPAHPSRTAANYPRTRRDAATVQRVAGLFGVPCLDAQLLFAQTGLPDDVLFIDFVHPSHFGIEALQAALAKTVAPLLALRPLRAQEERLVIVDIRPRTISAMGGELLTISTDKVVEEPIFVTIGGAPLLNAKLDLSNDIVGEGSPNKPGVHEIIVQSATGSTAWLADAVTLEAGRLEASSNDTRTLRVVSRSGDRIRVFISEKRTSPHWTQHGFCYLDAGTLVPLQVEATCGADGVAVVTLDAGLSGRGWAQALVLPGGVAEENYSFARWSNPLEVIAE